MVKTLYHSDFVTLEYDADNQLAVLNWKKNTDSEEYRKMFGAIIDFSQKNHIHLVLSDMRKQGLVREKDVYWLDQEVLKKTVEHKLERIAMVTDESIFSTVYSEVVKKKLEHSPIQVQVFNDKSTARAWLLSE